MEENKIYAVIDTNVIISALLSHNIQSSTYIVFDAILNGKITPIYNEDIINEYLEVLSRDKFPFQKEDIDMVATLIMRFGLKLERTKTIDEIFPDPKNIVFYEVAMSKDDAYLVTDNIKHFPKKPFVVTPAEMVEILNL